MGIMIETGKFLKRMFRMTFGMASLISKFEV